MPAVTAGGDITSVRIMLVGAWTPPKHDVQPSQPSSSGRDRKSVLVWPGNQFGPDELNSIFSKKYCIKIIFAKGSQNILM